MIVELYRSEAAQVLLPGGGGGVNDPKHIRQGNNQKLKISDWQQLQMCILLKKIFRIVEKIFLDIFEVVNQEKSLTEQGKEESDSELYQVSRHQSLRQRPDIHP